jgi:hypothetical protein
MADTDEQFYESDDAHALLESPGMLKVNHLSSSKIELDEPEIAANFMTRPISSGSTEVRAFTYGTPPKRGLQIPKKQAASLYAVSQPELHANPKANQPVKGDVFDSQLIDRR